MDIEYFDFNQNFDKFQNISEAFQESNILPYNDGNFNNINDNNLDVEETFNNISKSIDQKKYIEQKSININDNLNNKNNNISQNNNLNNINNKKQ